MKRDDKKYETLKAEMEVVQGRIIEMVKLTYPDVEANVRWTDKPWKGAGMLVLSIPSGVDSRLYGISRCKLEFVPTGAGYEVKVNTKPLSQGVLRGYAWSKSDTKVIPVEKVAAMCIRHLLQGKEDAKTRIDALRAEIAATQNEEAGYSFLKEVAGEFPDLKLNTRVTSEGYALMIIVPTKEEVREVYSRLNGVQKTED